ncbi:LacI family DNA-binding transcriptional regulator [Mucilaginibacter aquatilis]|uniref:Substrate-binding domain-containing protein n=1 Tax=Mucilaginibacter aquatilis TaxID=1517760 RepID=A0A6I4I9T2_9SPHI|nr:LacI family DNA-binding transcriptional regulator [Mucilaginibacter aquatilis]MVN91965.1 substrate-binding domain-containing protein [Mucilaginibacter aquatilis]
MFKPYTIKDIAKALGLSTSTVSRALNGSYEIGTETKKLVLEYAEKVNYRPNPIALSLKEQRSRSIGVVVCEVANNYFSQAINGIESIAYSSGYHVIITQTHESAAREAANVQHLLSRHVDGLLIALSAETTDTSEFKFLHSKGFPMVFFDRIVENIDTHKVTVDNFKGAFEATEQLLNAGYTKIANLASTPNLLNTRERFDGYKAALLKHNIQILPEYVKYCHHGGMVAGEVENALQELMSLPDPPQAIISTNDRLTTGCIPILKKMGYRIPEDVALTGFTNSEVAESFAPPLTVIRQPAFTMGQMATEMLINVIESKYPVYEAMSTQVDTELIVRQSSMPAKI